MNKSLRCISLVLGSSACLLTAQEAPPPQGNPPPPPDGHPGGPGSGRQRPPSPIIEALDLNKDGILDKEELKKAAESLKKLDKNRDGKITEDEYRPQRPPGGFAPGGQGGPPPNGRGGPPPDAPTPPAAEASGNTRFMKRLRFVCFRLMLGLTCFLNSAALAHPDHSDDLKHDHPPSSPSSSPPSTLSILVAAVADERGEQVKNTVKVTNEGEFRVMKSNGWPDHAPGDFPRRGNPNKPTAQSYLFRMPLHPKAAAAPERRGGWWWGVALNGVPFEPGTGETWNNDMHSGWRYEAATGFLNLGLDEHNAHVQPNGSYHYHALPVGLVDRLGGDGKQMRQIGWAADGFPLYTSVAHAKANDAKSDLKKMKSSYKLKSGARPAQENGPGGNYDGRFTQDFEYVPGSGDLDETNGRNGVTPEFPEGTYYYCITAEFPFVPRQWHGTPDQSFSKGDRPPGGQGRPAPLGGAPRGILEGGPGPSAPPNPPSNPMPSPGAPRGGPNLPVMGALDLNKDGTLDMEEIGKAMESLKTLDKNGDGQITPEEYRPSGAPPGPPNANPPEGAPKQR